MSQSLLGRFLSLEGNDYVRTLLLQEIDAGNTGLRYFTFNLFNVALDFDAMAARIEDELDPAAVESLPMGDLADALRDVSS